MLVREELLQSDFNTLWSYSGPLVTYNLHKNITFEPVSTYWKILVEFRCYFELPFVRPQGLYQRKDCIFFLSDYFHNYSTCYNYVVL